MASAKHFDAGCVLRDGTDLEPMLARNLGDLVANGAPTSGPRSFSFRFSEVGSIRNCSARSQSRATSGPASTSSRLAGKQLRSV